MCCSTEGTSKEGTEDEISSKMLTICPHTFSDLTHVSPAAFMYLLKECYTHGTHKATAKFRLLLLEVRKALHSNPQPGPFSFVIQCLYVVPLLGPSYTEGFSHMMISSIKHIKTLDSVQEDFCDSKQLAAQLVLDVLASLVPHEDRILIKLLDIFEIELRDVANALYGSEFNDEDLNKAKTHLKQYVHSFIKSEAYMVAITLIERFGIEYSDESFLLKLIESSQFKAAEKWATFMGKPMLHTLVQKYLDLKMLKNAYEMVKQNDLRDEFPDVSYMYKESLLKKLAEKGCWDVAENRAKKDRKLIEYLVYLAMEAGYTEKVDELCERYSLEGFVNSLVPDEIYSGSDYLDLEKLVLDEIVWVDDIDGLLNATEYIESCKIIGVDCEWKPNYEKGSKPNKVSIMQIASDKKAFIIDLIKLYDDEPKVLNSCFRRILCSSNILKLGYNLQCDLHQLSHSYGELECFRSYEMLLDIQKLFKETSGGLSGLSKKILGAGLNKTRRNSNWEQRPLTEHQKEYAALDAAVLVHIFHHVGGQPHVSCSEGCKVEWKSHIVSRMTSSRTPLR